MQWESMPLDDADTKYSQQGTKTKYLVILSLLGLLWIFLSVRTVPPAHAGIAVTLGSVASELLPAGIHLRNPLCSVVHFNLKTQLLYSENIVPTQEGLNVELDVALLYHVDTEKVTIPVSLHPLLSPS